MMGDRSTAHEGRDGRDAGLRTLAARILAGDGSALARGISMAEAGDPGLDSLLEAVRAGGKARAHRIGVTGAPGVGKSTLVRELAQALRGQGEKVGILAIDPSSARSGGALLGDRIRMGVLARDEGTFIRSMAARGALGGLAPAARSALDLMEGAGFDRILLETVGVGQSEAEVARTTDTVLLVLVPGLGDGIQAMKAGLMEVADLFVLNKGDLPGAARLEVEVREAVELSVPRESGWSPPILGTVAERGAGIAQLLEAVDRHRKWPRATALGGEGPRVASGPEKV